MRSSLVGIVALTLAFLADDAARAAPGDQDTTFSSDGELLYDIAGGPDNGHALAIAANGAIVVVGEHTDTGETDDFALVRINPGGGVQVRTTNINDGEETAYAVAMLGTGGTIVATGFTRPSGPDEHFAAVRYKPDLELDPTFNGTGKATVDFGSHSLSKGVAIDSQFNMVAVGTAKVGGGEDDFALARLEPEDGALDMGFSQDGKQVTDLGGADQGNAVAIDTSGRLVVAGVAGPAFGSDFGVARYRALDGSLDPSFSQDGVQKTDFGSGGDYASDVAIQADGKIVVAGQSTGGFALARYDTDGTLDTTFSGDGKQTTAFGGQSDIATGVAIQGDGRIVVAGHSFAPGGATSRDFALARYNPDGSLDPSFSGDGKLTADLGGNDIAEDIAIQSDGRIVLAGYQGDLYGSDNKFAIARFEGGGTPPDTDGDGKPDAQDACPNVAAATADGCPAPVVVPDPFPAPANPAPALHPPTTGTAGPDVFAGTAGNDIFRAGAANDRLSGGPGADLLCGEAGDDQIDGEAGADQLYGDFCPGARLAAVAPDGNDAIRGGSGNDRLVGSGGNDRLTGGSGKDRLDGGAGRDKLDGGAGDDQLSGGPGNDTLAGGAGKNRYSGGAGNDKVSAANGKRDRVDCGAGRRDSARVDRRDRVKGCEKVSRRR